MTYCEKYTIETKLFESAKFLQFDPLLEIGILIVLFLNPKNQEK